MEMIKKCLNPKVLIGLGIVALAVLLVAPKTFFTILPLLIIVACPLSMIAMMTTMNTRHQADNKQHSTKDKE